MKSPSFRQGKQINNKKKKIKSLKAGMCFCMWMNEGMNMMLQNKILKANLNTCTLKPFCLWINSILYSSIFLFVYLIVLVLCLCIIFSLIGCVSVVRSCWTHSLISNYTNPIFIFLIQQHPVTHLNH